MSIRELKVVTPWDHQMVRLKVSCIIKDVLAQTVYLLVGVERGGILIDHNRVDVSVEVPFVVPQVIGLMVVIRHTVSKNLNGVSK